MRKALLIHYKFVPIAPIVFVGAIFFKKKKSQPKNWD